MLLDNFRRKINETTSINRTLFIIALASTLSATALSFKMLGSHERIVLVPPHVDERMEITWNSANASYYKSFALYISGLIGNITPQNIDFILDVLSNYLHSSIYADARVKLKAIAEDPLFKDSGAYSYFIPKRVVYEPDTKKTFVVGDIILGTASRQPRPEGIVYEFIIRMENGMPMIYSLQSYKGNEPHTLEWLRSHPEIDKKQTAQ